MTFFRCLCLLFILCCCNSKPKTDAGMIRVSVLRGPSAIAFAHWMKETPVIDGKPLSVRIIDSPDLMQAKASEECHSIKSLGKLKKKVSIYGKSHKKCRCGKNHSGTPITFLKIKLRQQTRFSLYS